LPWLNNFEVQFSAMVPKSTITELSSAPIPITAGNKLAGHRVARRPSSNFKLHKDYYLLTIAAPVYRRENFDIKVIGNILQIKASKNNGPKCQFGRCEYEFADWQRSFLLPPDADPLMATARYHNGELNIILSKNEKLDAQEGEYRVYVY